MFQENLLKLVVLLAALNQLAQSSEARNVPASQLNEQNNDDYQGLVEGQYQPAGHQLPLAAHQQQVAAANGGGAAPVNLDSDDDDDDDDRVELQPALLPGQLNQAASSSPFPNEQPMLLANANNDQVYQQPAAPGADLKPAASKHYGHHGHGAKGWLDMGAWTGKKGAFGWYDKHPVGGKGK